jgi:O-antigen/teichoic acid export membrane protein
VIRRDLIARNAALNLVGQVLPLLVAIAAMPRIVRGLGAAEFGILGIAWLLLSYVSEIGFGRATTKFIAEAIAKHEHAELGRVAWATITLQAGIGGALAAILALTTTWLTYDILKIPGDLAPDAEIALLIVACMVPAVLIGAAFRGVIEAAQRFDLVNLVRVPASAANFLLPLIALGLGWHLRGVLVLLLLSRIAVLFAFAILALRLFPVLRSAVRFDQLQMRKVIRFGSWITVSSLAGPMVLYLDRFLLGVLVSIAAVGYYTAPYELVTRLWIIPASLNATLFPAFSTLATSKQHRGAQQLAAQSMKFLAVAVAPAVVVIIAGAPDLLRVWIGDDYAVTSAAALQILAVGVLVNSIAHVPYSLIQGVGRADLTAKLQVIEVPIHLGISLLLIPILGVTGAALAWTIRNVLDAILVFLVAARVAGIDKSVIASERLPQTALLILAWSVAGVLAVPLISSSAWRLVLLAVIASAMALSSWIFAFTQDDKRYLRRVAQVPFARWT